MMIQLKDVGVSFGARALFAGINLTIGDHSRIGLVGANGTGKTTLFRMLKGESSPDEGSIDMPKDINIGYLPQEEIVMEDESIFDAAVAAFDHVHELRVRMHKLEQSMQDPSLSQDELDKILSRYSRFQEEYARDGYTFESRTAEILQGLGFKKQDLDRPCREFSGGYQMRVALARLLLSEPDLLLLDEPTNHLDLPSIEWLERFIKNFKGALVISSHDRFFLDRVVDSIWGVDYGTVTSYKGNYTKFNELKKSRKEQIEKEIKKIAETRKHLQRFIDRFRGTPKKAVLVRSRKKMLARLPDVSLPKEDTKTMNLSFPDAPKISGRVLALEDISKSFDSNQVFSDVNLTVEPGDRLALVGANGEGKTTLLRIIAGELDATSGEVWRSSKLLSAFYTQIVEARLHPENTVLGELEEIAPGEAIPALRTIAGMFLFPGDEADKKVSVLSGGEKSRLALAKIILSPSNLLLLDEPTNHLDLRARDVLEHAIGEYPGTVIFSAHDRFLIDRLANKVVYIGDGKANVHLGNWTDYEQWRERRRTRKTTERKREVTKNVNRPYQKKGKSKPPVKDKEKTRLQRLREEETNRVFAEIEDAEKEVAALEREMSNPELYEDPDRMRKVTSRHRSLKQELKHLHEQLEGLLS
ncbi:ATP-binding cassette domain-containing protein [candidate division WOR-3 bacterium]|uniref:ATP-binding cassette domain-containing protein n=1 Tax=candidate division WOR-3 bacterium TaxID=2052148 RepID=A0A9D5KAC7_UNCW3|nr:ATP-binding cassette domain-containing protein [candidate division WOR-3 bacterium]MBD3365094.1 ATP-binding cassette domain-containing protein [candidate division WOR-3 bacterium]